MERPPQEPGNEGWLPPEPPGGGQLPGQPFDPPDSAEPPHAPASEPRASRAEPPQGAPPSPPPQSAPRQAAPAPPPPPASPAQAQPGYGYAPPGYPPPPQQPYGYAYGQPYYGQPYYQQQYPGQYAAGWQQQAWAPPGQWPQQPAYAHPSYGPEPDNDPAIASLTLALSGLGLLFFSFGFSAAVVSPAAGAFAIYYGRKGMQKVDKGETRRYRGAAKAGFIIGVVTVVLSIVAAAIWIIVIASNPDVFDESSTGVLTALGP
jgi:hypothetical protein